MNWQPEPTIDDFNGLNDIFESYKDIIFDEREWLSKTKTLATPTLGEARGKVVLLKCVGKSSIECENANGNGRGLKEGDSFLGGTISNDWKDQIHDPGHLPWLSPDFIGCNDPDRYKNYLNKLENHVRKAGAPVIEDEFFMTWVSFSPPGHECRIHIANGFDHFLKEEFNLKTDVPYGRLYGTGIVVMDFPTKNYIKTIIQFNFRGNENNKLLLISNIV